MTDPATKLPPAWKPRQGETLVGFITSRQERDSQYSDEQVTVITLDAGDEEVSLWCSPKMLSGWVKDENPQPGEWIEILYDGQKATRGGHFAKVFYPRVVRDEH